MPSQQTAARLLHAVEVFRSSRTGTGIPKESVKLDMTSRTTRDHAEELNKKFQEKNIKIGLVTSAHHIKRGKGEFKKIFSEENNISNRGENLNKLTDFLSNAGF